MSYGEELWEEMLISEALDQERITEEYLKLYGLVDIGIWVKRDGTSVFIEDMDSRHIQNSIAMMERNEPLYNELTLDITRRYREVMKKELEKRFPPVDPAFAWG